MKEIKNLSKIRLFLGIVITAVAMFIFMPINVFATTDYEIYVNGEQFTSEKTTINCGDGTATFDISTNTLILNNATITKRYGYQYAVINSEISNLTIQLIGNNVIDGNKGEYDGIGADGGSNVVIVGDGNLTIKDVYYGTYIGDYSVPGGNLKINNTTINIENAQATGIWVNHDLEIINSNIKIDKTGDDVYFGIVSNIGGTITIDGGNLDINTNSHCILLGNGDNSNHNVVIKSGNIKLNSRRNGAYGIKFEPVQNTDTINGNIKIDGGNLEISAIAGGTNIDDSKITINSKVKFLKGTSLKDNGKILLNEAKNYYTVSFAANGGTGSMADATGVSGDYVLPVCGFTAPNGKQFKAWSVGGVEKAAGDTITVNANTTVTAIWENIPVTYYTVTFDSNGGSAVTAQSIEAGQKATKPADPTKDGYDFKGWTLNGSAYDFNTAVNGNITLVATWEQQQVVPTTYTVSFAANGGTGTMADVTGISGEYTLPENGFTAPDGKQFKAWSVGGVEKAVGDKITVTADTTVTAVWEDIPAGHTCDIKPVAKVEPSCTEAGKEAYYKCEGCGKFYEDALGTKEITDLAAWGNLAKLGHTESDWKSDKDNHWKECTVAGCGVIIENSKAAHADANNDGKCDTCEYNVGIPTTPGGDKPNDNPQTGDNSMMGLWIALLFVSGFGVVTTTVYTKKRKSVK